MTARDDLSPLPGGDFDTWLGSMQTALEGSGESDVPCGECAACCTASQFVHIAPDEAGALAHIPAALLFTAPGLPAGHVLMGYDSRGHCPMLVDGACSIYAHRPRTCRTYDCRVFAAARVQDPDPSKAAVARRAIRWQFTYDGVDAERRHDAVAAAAAFLVRNEGLLPDDLAPATATQLAVLAVVIHDCFLTADAASGEVRVCDPDPDVVRSEVVRRSA